MERSEHRGKAAEHAVMAELLLNGYDPHQPVRDNTRHDLTYTKDGDLVRAQVKTGRFHEDKGVVVFNTASRRYNSDGENERLHYDSSEVDVFLVYCPERREVFRVPVDEASRSSMRLRVDEAGCDHPSINWASDYRF